MKFIDQLKAEVQLHDDMQTDFRSRRYQHAQDIARKYIDIIEEQARTAARAGDYIRVEGHALISGFCTISEKDFDMPFIEITTKKKMIKGKRLIYSLSPNNELFEVFLSSFQQFCAEEDIIYSPFQAQILNKENQICYHTLPFTLLRPKKEQVQAFGFPYQIEF